jgi:hypothetical protein
MKPGSKDIKTNILISGDELTELKRHILSLRFDGEKINAEWLAMEKYLALNKKDVTR